MYWSALQEVDLAGVPTDGRDHDLSVYMQDTGWPDAPLDDYIELWDHDYWQIMRQTPPDKKLLDIQACFQVAHGSGIRPEAILMQKIMNFETLGRLLTSGRGARPHHLARHLHGQGAGGAGPVGVQAAPDQHLVAALVGPGTVRRRSRRVPRVGRPKGEPT